MTKKTLRAKFLNMYRLGRNYIKLFYLTAIFILRLVQRVCAPRTACILQNIFVIFTGSGARYGYDTEKKLFFVKERVLIRYFGDMERGFDFYGRSIEKRGDSLAKSYCIDDITFSKSDIVIDCGANYGDFFLYLADKIEDKNYIGIEPGPVEFECVKNSLPNATLLNIGLSDTRGQLDFYLCSETGDSSLVKPVKYSEKIKVDVDTLDNIGEQLDIKTCKLLKLEAEGWEPEILEGAGKFLEKCEYIAVDGGRERGVKSELTLHKVNSKLNSCGFEMIDLNGPGYRALYRRTF